MLRGKRKKLLNNKSAAKNSKAKNKKKSSQNMSSSQANCSTTSELDFTLPDENHLDSFDLFRKHEEKILKANHVLKKDVNATYNRDSSVENISIMENLHLTDPLSTSSVILIQDKENTINIDETDSFGHQSLHFDHSCPISNNNAQKECQEMSRSESTEPKPKSSVHRFLRQNDLQTSTPQKSFSVLPRPTHFFQNYENEPTAHDQQPHSACDNNTNGINKTVVLPESSNVATQRRQQSIKKVQIVTPIHEPNDGTEVTKHNNLDSIMEIDQIEIFNERNAVDNLRSHYLKIISSRERRNEEHDKNCVRKPLRNSLLSITVNSDNSSSSNSSHVNEPLTVDVEVHRADELIPTTTTASIPNTNRLTKVGFDASCIVHDQSTSFETTTNEMGKILMKGGKWRRTIAGMRKNKISRLSRLTLQAENNQNGRQSNKRKSIFVKDIPDRNRLTNHLHRKVSHIAVSILDDSDDTSIHSPELSPKSTSIEVRSKRNTKLTQTIYDSFDLQLSQKSASMQSRSQLSSFQKSLLSESTLDGIETSTSTLNIECDQDKLKTQLLKRCGQKDVLSINEIYSARVLRKCKKIGEGVYGEVFLNDTIVFKIIPIEGDVEMNGVQQKRFNEILQEVIISQELSALRCNEKNSTSGFVEVVNVRLVEGRYPTHLLRLWNDYDDRKGSENDCPDVFDGDQLYIVFELMNCGDDLEAYKFKNAEQSYSAFKQVAFSLAVAEEQFQFEHRDLHWGNVLVASTTEKTLKFHLDGKPIEVQTHGIKATIIDYTLSRIVYKECCLYQDLATDPELFEATGDRQYDIYRLMREETNNYWENFVPYTNILWLHYIIDKMTVNDGVKYTATKSAKHRRFIDEMIELQQKLLEYRSTTEYANDSLVV